MNDTVKHWQEYFGLDLPSVLWAKRMQKFEVKCGFNQSIKIFLEWPKQLTTARTTKGVTVQKSQDNVRVGLLEQIWFVLVY